MRVSPALLLLTIFVQACSLASPKPTSTPTETSTPTVTATRTVTPTVTPSPTIVHFPTSTDISTGVVPIFTGVKTATPVLTITPVSTITPSGPGPGFDSIAVSDHKLYYGICKPHTVKITAQLQDPQNVYNVVFFVRLKSAKKEDYTVWDKGTTMDDHGQGLWTYTLNTNTIAGHHNYVHAWIQYQIVATDRAGNFVARSWIFTQSMTLQPCM